MDTDLGRWRQHLANERAEADVYRRLAQRRTGQERDILLTLADEHEKLAGGVDSAIEIGVVDEKIDPSHTRSKLTQALAEAPARRGRHKNIPL